MKIFVTNNDMSVSKMFRNRGHEIVEKFTDDFDLICFTGGADVTPFLYGESRLKCTYPSLSRDKEEVSYWKVLDPDFPKVGICRGAQLGNVMCGGTLWQDVDKHAGRTHMVRHLDPRTPDKWTIWMVNSYHHQMCRLTPRAKKLVIATTSTQRISEHEIQHMKQADHWEDIEAFYYKDYDFLGVQWHPEYGHQKSEELFFKYFDNYYTAAYNSEVRAG